MKTIVLAYHNMGCVGIRKLLANDFDIIAVFTHKDDPSESRWFESVAELAAAENIPVYAPDDINHPLWINRIQALEPDMLFSFYYRKMVGREFLSLPSKGCLNLHGSYLPGYRGRCPINWVLINGENQTGVTLHFMTEKPDDGDIVIQKKIPISDEDTARTLNEKTCRVSADMLDEILPKIKSGKIPRIHQDHYQSSYFGGRRPEDGQIDWSQDAVNVRNLVRAVTTPYPGAFSHMGDKKCFFWQVTQVSAKNTKYPPGSVVSSDPLVIQCGRGQVQVDFGQVNGGIYVNGAQFARELNLSEGMRFGLNPCELLASQRKKRVLILGVGGFIGNALSERLLESGRYEVHGMDLYDEGIRRLMDRPGFYYHEGDIAIHREWIEYHIKKCDIILPLVAIATPAEYTRNPIKVFELDFEENLRVVRYCVKYNKRLIFPSSSEVYGMSDDLEFDEETSRLILGPINKQRWIYSCSKQLLDRVIWAYGQKEGLQFTLFRPFNWIGPRLDSLNSARIGSSRAITQLILNMVEGTPIQLVDGGNQKRCFTDVSDGVECLYRIIENKEGKCNGQIINIGNPDNDVSIRILAELLVKKFQEHPLREKFPTFAGIKEVESKVFYGEGYQDVEFRKPSIKNAWRLVRWRPVVKLEESVTKTLDFFLNAAVSEADRLSETVESMSACRTEN